MNVDEKLKELGASELVGGFAAWKGPALCPYTQDELRAYANLDERQNELKALKEEIERASEAEWQQEQPAVRRSIDTALVLLRAHPNDEAVRRWM